MFMIAMPSFPIPQRAEHCLSTMAAQTPPQSALREFCPLYYLLNAIPAKVQKGFRSVVVYLTALDTNSDYIAVGSSIGMLYLYCRRVRQINKYSIEVSMPLF